MLARRSFDALDLQRAQYNRIEKRLNSDPELRKRWVGTLVDVILAERKLAELQATMREIFRDKSADALVLLRRDADAIADGRQSLPELVPNPNANRIQGHEIDSRKVG